MPPLVLQRKRQILKKPQRCLSAQDLGEIKSFTLRLLIVVKCSISQQYNFSIAKNSKTWVNKNWFIPVSPREIGTAWAWSLAAMDKHPTFPGS